MSMPSPWRSCGTWWTGSSECLICLLASFWSSSSSCILSWFSSLMGSPLQSLLMPLLDDPPNCVLLAVVESKVEVLVSVGADIFDCGSSFGSDSNDLLIEDCWAWTFSAGLSCFFESYFIMASILCLQISLWLCADFPSLAILHPKHPCWYPYLMRSDL